jgi:hypothetical protein
MTQEQLPHWWPAAAAILVLVGLAGLYIFIKIEQLLVKLVGGLVTLVLLAGAVWWFFFRH